MPFRGSSRIHITFLLGTRLRRRTLSRADWSQSALSPYAAAVSACSKNLEFRAPARRSAADIRIDHRRRESQEQPTARYRATQISTRRFFAAPASLSLQAESARKEKDFTACGEPFGRRASALRRRVSHDVARAQDCRPSRHSHRRSRRGKTTCPPATATSGNARGARRPRSLCCRGRRGNRGLWGLVRAARAASH